MLRAIAATARAVRVAARIAVAEVVAACIPAWAVAWAVVHDVLGAGAVRIHRCREVAVRVVVMAHGRRDRIRRERIRHERGVLAHEVRRLIRVERTTSIAVAQRRGLLHPLAVRGPRRHGRRALRRRDADAAVVHPAARLGREWDVGHVERS